jgi:hypothetical protein
MRYFIDYGFYLVELTFEEITCRIEYRQRRYHKLKVGDNFYLVKTW